MRKIYRLHGDNIVECERISNLLIGYLNPVKVERSFSSLACINLSIDFVYEGQKNEWSVELFPGFNKNTHDRWSTNILELLKQQGSFLDETPDVILTKVSGEYEEIVAAVEFCSALQAGNQAWQRSGRAYSTGRTECAYLYIVDFVKYELDTKTRKRKALRYPNAAVPYSYISHSINHKNFVAQAYFKAEEFQPTFDKALSGFDTGIFSEKEVANYLTRKLLGLSTKGEEKALLDKNICMVNFLAEKAETKKNFTPGEWDELYTARHNLIDYCVAKNRFLFRKKIAEKSIVGKVKEFNLLVQKYSTGLASVDLPFGIIPKKNRVPFVDELIKLYKISDGVLISSLKRQQDLVVCLLKGFKPEGDDNRPDRGALPLIAMLAGENTEIMTFIYGPIVSSNLKGFDTDIMTLANRNGLWKSFVGLSDFIIIDSPIRTSSVGIARVQAHRILDNIQNKQELLKRSDVRTTMMISNIPNRYQENDVDTVIHMLFKHIVSGCFEGMCNPPGGDWSGLSIEQKGIEYRWLSLPRVSSDGKRPDHVIEIFDLLKKPLILSIESKEHAVDLEPDVGNQLKNYLKYLFDFAPSTEKKHGDEWNISNEKLKFDDFTCVSVGAYIDTGDIDFASVFVKSKCDILFELFPKPASNEWVIKMRANSNDGKTIVSFLKTQVDNYKPYKTLKVETD